MPGGFQDWTFLISGFIEGFIEGSRPPSGCQLLNAKCFFFLLLCDEVARLLLVCPLSS